MAATPCNAGAKVTATYAAAAINSCTGGSFRFTVNFTKYYPDTRKSPAGGATSLDCEAEVEAAELVTPLAFGTPAALVFSITQLDGGINTVTLDTMEAAGSSGDFNTAPFKQRHMFTFNPANTEDTAPIAVT